ncbi:hypothetical protein OHU17_00780 [Streptomyces goshikiensis]|uniref:HTH cro/C1-type domain-containing protein n=1 Tax=Streptomyces goshikiensis TaxID=1942 RepID=A0ABZ1RD64_9ACTN|nr:helix-turn-helix domain-containing protein [Streptomyces goshikiensis]
MNQPRETTIEQAAYAAALREAAGTFPGTQREIAEATHVGPSTLSRYLNGTRLAPLGFPQALGDFLALQGHPLEQSTLDHLMSLGTRAHQASKAPAFHLALLRQDMDQLTARHDGLREKAEELTRRLDEALERAIAAEHERDTHAGRLRHAQAYSHQMEDELQRLRAEGEQLRREVQVLARQNRLLLEGTAGDVAGETVSSPLAQPSVLGPRIQHPAPPNLDHPSQDHQDPVYTGAGSKGGWRDQLARAMGWKGGASKERGPQFVTDLDALPPAYEYGYYPMV